MTAGSGIVYSERTPERLLGRETRLSGLQVWMALPKTHEETAPSFQHYKADELPAWQGDGISTTLVAGRAWGKTAPVAVYSETLYADMRMTAGASTIVDPEHGERALYLLSGAVDIAGARFDPGAMLVLKSGIAVEVGAAADTHLVLIGGAPMDGPRIKWWNLVSSSRARIDQAKADWRDGRFPKIPSDAEEFIPPAGQIGVT